MNDNVIDEFDIDFDYKNELLGYQNGYGCDTIERITNEITAYIKENLILTMKDDKKYIHSNTKGNSVFFASPCIKITMPSKIYFKKIVISTKDTIVGYIDEHNRGRRDAKPKYFWVKLYSWNDEKTRNNLVQEFKVKNHDYTCIIHNYAPLKDTGNTMVS